MLAAAIERARKKLKLNHKEFAALLGISVQAVSKIKRGGGVNGETLALLQERGGVYISKRLIASLGQNRAA